MRPAPCTPRRNCRLTSAAAVVMLLLQLVVALAPLGEGRHGRSMGPHVDASGPNSHYTHDEATCAACQARTLQGSMSYSPPVLAFGVRRVISIVSAPDAAPPASPLVHQNPRAPPTLT